MKSKLLLTALVVYAANAFGATPLHHYTFNGQTVTDSVGSAEGSLLGGAVVSSGTLGLNGTSAYVEFAEELIPTSNFSVTLFAQELSSVSDRAEIISQGWTYAPGFYMGYYGRERYMRVGDQWQATGVRFPADGLMHHYAVTTDALESRLYIDGVCVATNTPIGIGSVGGTNTRLGQQFGSWGEFFHGSLDEVWVFSGALTSQEVAGLAAAIPLSPKLSIEVSQVRLCWQTQTNVLYQLQYRSALATNEWVDLGTPISGTGGASCITQEVTDPRRYYRVVALPPAGP